MILCSKYLSNICSCVKKFRLTYYVSATFSVFLSIVVDLYTFSIYMGIQLFQSPNFIELFRNRLCFLVSFYCFFQRDTSPLFPPVLDHSWNCWRWQMESHEKYQIFYCQWIYAHCLNSLFPLAGPTASTFQRSSLPVNFANLAKFIQRYT